LPPDHGWGRYEFVIHTAAIYRYWTKDPATLAAVSLDGTRNIFAAARRAGVKRLVYTSSTWAIGLSGDPAKILTAEEWNERPHTPYARAKTISERSAWELAEQTGIPMIACCPGAMFGRHDYLITPSNQIVLGMADGSGRSFNSGLAIADVRDAGALHAMAVEQGEPGKRYAITHNLLYTDLAAIVSQFTGKKVAHFGAGNTLAKLVAGLMEVGAHLAGKEPPFTRALVDDANGRYMFVDSSATWEAFGYRPYPVRETVRASLEWFAQLGLLERQALSL
jgi:dihydroflavonol-4-reductase